MTKQIFIVILAALALVGAGCNSSNNVDNTSSTAVSISTSNQLTQKQLDLRQNMRKLWTDHVVWTRSYIVAAVDGSSDARAAADRLMQNQEDIGSAVANYYGQEAGSQLTTLLKEHIQIAVDIVAAAKADDQNKLGTDKTKWQDNANQIADFMSGANPNWPQQTLRDMMSKHLSTTNDELTARLSKDYAADVAAFDAVYDHILMMSDALSDGIIKQFPDKF